MGKRTDYNKNTDKEADSLKINLFYAFKVKSSVFLLIASLVIPIINIAMHIIPFVISGLFFDKRRTYQQHNYSDKKKCRK